MDFTPIKIMFWSAHKALALFVIARYFGYENDRTHVIKVLVLVVKITIQLIYGIQGRKPPTCCKSLTNFIT
jgi:hypothetical protein